MCEILPSPVFGSVTGNCADGCLLPSCHWEGHHSEGHSLTSLSLFLGSHAWSPGHISVIVIKYCSKQFRGEKNLFGLHFRTKSIIREVNF